MVLISTPDGAAKMFRAEGKYPVRSVGDKNMDWVIKSVNPEVESIGFT